MIVKQITIILHYDNDKEAEQVYASLRQIWRKEPEQAMSILGEEILLVEIRGPND